MKHKLIIALILLFVYGFHTCNAQTVKDINPKVVGNNIDISYSVKGLKFYESYNLTLYVSKDGGNTFQGPMKNITIDTVRHIIHWDVFKDINSIAGDLVFDIRGDVTRNRVPKSFFIQYNLGGLLSSTNYLAPFGITVGQLSRIGWYGSFLFNDFGSASLKYENEVVSPDALVEFNDQQSFPFLTVTGGGIYQLNWNSYLMFGLGYGYKKYYQGVNEFVGNELNSDNNWIEIMDKHEEYWMLELGGYYRIKSMNTGLSIYSFGTEHLGIKAGLGLIF